MMHPVDTNAQSQLASCVIAAVDQGFSDEDRRMTDTILTLDDGSSSIKFALYSQQQRQKKKYNDEYVCG